MHVLFLACENGTFGKHCKNNCSGNCWDNQPCNKTTGKCTKCLPGWKEGFCNESESIVITGCSNKNLKIAKCA